MVTVGHAKMSERERWKANTQSSKLTVAEIHTLLLLQQHEEAVIWTGRGSQCGPMARP